MSLMLKKKKTTTMAIRSWDRANILRGVNHAELKVRSATSLPTKSPRFHNRKINGMNWEFLSGNETTYVLEANTGKINVTQNITKIDMTRNLSL